MPPLARAKVAQFSRFNTQVRDLLGLASTFGGVTILPKFYCHCDRYWNFLSK